MRVRGAAIRRASGFTLMELMITVVILAILASIAIPSYVAYVERGKRAAARSALLAAASFLERNFTTNGCYNFRSVDSCQKQAGTDSQTIDAYSPSEGKASYRITADFSGSGAGQAYTLTAEPCKTADCSKAPGGFEPFSDECGKLTLTHTGARDYEPKPEDKDKVDMATCWQR